MTSDLIAELVTANAILAARQIVDGFGHVSVRCVDGSDRFLLARSMAPALVRRADILIHGRAGEPIDAGDARPYLERFVHSAIYAARPEVMAIVHSHSAAMVTFAAVPSATLQPIYHMAAFLGGGVARFDIGDVAGDASDMLVRDATLGDALAGSLGQSPLVLMRGHGSTVVGTSLRQAVYRAVYAETNARLQMDALRLGEPVYLSRGEAAAAEHVTDQQIDRAWELWRRDLPALD